MKFSELVRKRKSVRAFKKKSVDWRAIMDALDDANQGPMAGNVNTLRTIIIEDTDTIKTLAKYTHQSWIAQAPAIIVVCSNDSRLVDMYGEQGKIYARQQVGAAIQTILLSLTEKEIATTWVGYFTEGMIKTVLKIPGHMVIDAIIPVGYEKFEKVKAERKKQDIESTIYWDEWDKRSRPTMFKDAPLRG